MTSEQETQQNPFIKPYDTPLGVPPFDRIKNNHFIPAFEEGIRQQQVAIAEIEAQKAHPDFENTIEALEKSGPLLIKVSSVFFNLNSANTSPELEAISQQVVPKLSKNHDDIFLNKNLFKRIKTVYDNRENLNIGKVQQRLLEKTYKAFIRNGANLEDEQQERMRAINKELSLLTLDFGQHLLAENNAYELLVDEEAALCGLPDALKGTAARSAAQAGNPEKWLFTLHNPSIMPFLQYAENRSLREEIYQAYINRGNNDNASDNKTIISNIVSLRAERAGLLGYTNYAAFVLEESMAKDPEQAYELLKGLWKAALPVAVKEAEVMQHFMDEEGKEEKIQAWDWSYYADKVRKARYSYDAEALRPYFQLDAVKDGFFQVARKLYGITFHKRTDIPVYHEDVSAYEVKGADGELIGVIYMDFFARKSKRGGAWMTSYEAQSYQNGKRKAPVISIVCNFSGPNETTPALFTADEVRTFYHEMGHALHGLLSDVPYRSLAGTAVPRDFVELPSQVMEHFAFESEVLNSYAKHYQTGELIPETLVERMKSAEKFNQGFETVEYLAAALLDMGYHTRSEGLSVDPLTFEQQEMESYGLISQITPRYRSTYFQHIFSGGYAAGYYSYIWSAVLDSDAFAAFKETGNIFHPEVANAFRKQILEKGAVAEPMELYLAFRGKSPDMKHLLNDRGLFQAQVNNAKQPTIS